MILKDHQSEYLKSEETTIETKPKLRVIQGGKGPPEGPTSDWLGELTPGTTFVTRATDKYVDYELYHVVFKTLDAVLLKWELPDGKFWDRFVNSKEFSKRYTDHIILGIQEAAESSNNQKEQQHDGNEQRDTRRLPDVVLHEAVQGEHQVPDPLGRKEPDLYD